MLVTKLTFGSAMIFCAGILLAAAGSVLAPAGGPQQAGSPTTKTDPSNAKDQARSRNATADDTAALQGEWRTLEGEVNGKKVTGPDTIDLCMIFKDNAITLQSASGRGGERKQTYKLVPGHSPKAIDITSLDGQEKGQTAACIYSLEKGRLILCFPKAGPGKRPEEFKTKEGDGCIVLTLGRVGAKETTAALARNAQAGDPVANAFRDVRLEWMHGENKFWNSYGKAKTLDQRRRAEAERDNKKAALALRALTLAEANPNHPVVLSAFFWAYCQAPNLAAGQKALDYLLGGRIAHADLGVLAQALELANPGAGYDTELAKALLARARATPDHPQAGYVLAEVCAKYHKNHSAAVPALFAEAAELILTHCADKPGIQHFCETLAPMADNPPPWAGQYERHLRAILEKNRDRLVRVTAEFALASVIASAGDSRLLEAATLFEQFTRDFDGSDPRIAGVEKNLATVAKAKAEDIRQRRPGLPAPEIDGVDLDGKPLKLSQFRGKVVLLSFWATTCAPCMNLVPQERALAKRLANKPFALVGVNEDDDPAQLRAVLQKTSVPWPSFKNRRPGRPALTQDWKILAIPTFYLIDHEGIMRKHWVGAPPAKELDHLLDELISAVPPKK